MKKYLWGVLYAAVLTSFTVYILLDTFVIARVYRQAPSDGVSAAESVEENTAEITGNSYEDGNISVTITEHRVNDTAVYAADVRLKSAEYLKTALSNEAYGKNVTEKNLGNRGKKQRGFGDKRGLLRQQGKRIRAQKRRALQRNGGRWSLYYIRRRGLFNTVFRQGIFKLAAEIDKKSGIYYNI